MSASRARTSKQPFKNWRDCNEGNSLSAVQTVNAYMIRIWLVSQLSPNYFTSHPGVVCRWNWVWSWARSIAFRISFMSSASWGWAAVWGGIGPDCPVTHRLAGQSRVHFFFFLDREPILLHSGFALAGLWIKATTGVCANLLIEMNTIQGYCYCPGEQLRRPPWHYGWGENLCCETAPTLRRSIGLFGDATVDVLLLVSIAPVLLEMDWL